MRLSLPRMMVRPGVLLLVNNAYRDPLILRDFGVQLPADASIAYVDYARVWITYAPAVCP
jgi:hypothetical protein